MSGTAAIRPLVRPPVPDLAAAEGAACWLATRAEVTWNGCGRPSGRRATASPSITAAVTSMLLAIATISGTRSVMSSRVLVNTRTSSPVLCIWIRMPSIFHSRTAGVILASAASRSGADAASMGRTGCPTRSVNERRTAVTAALRSAWLARRLSAGAPSAGALSAGALSVGALSVGALSVDALSAGALAAAARAACATSGSDPRSW